MNHGSGMTITTGSQGECATCKSTCSGRTFHDNKPICSGCLGKMRKPTTMRVYKYSLRVDDETCILMPADAKVLAVQEQDGQPCIWALVDPDSPITRRFFRVTGTGHDISWQHSMEYRGTFQLKGGALVFHLFEYA